MSDEPAEFEADELLRTIGKVPRPEPRVLEHAREALWSAIASEMLRTDPAAEEATAVAGPAGTEEEQRRTARRRQTYRPQNESKRAMGGRGPD